MDPVPYVGIQYVAIPEVQGIGTQVGQSIAAAPSGQMNVDGVLEAAQATTERTMEQAGYMPVTDRHAAARQQPLVAVVFDKAIPAKAR